MDFLFDVAMQQEKKKKKTEQKLQFRLSQKPIAIYTSTLGGKFVTQ